MKATRFMHIFILFVVLSAVSADAQIKYDLDGQYARSDSKIQNLFVGTDGNVDLTFGNGLAGVGGVFLTNTVNSMVLQPDGKIVIVGTFTLVNGVAQNNVARLNTDGTLDTTFGSGLTLTGPTFIINVSSVALQTDGKVLIGGDFLSVNGSLRSGIARLNADGSLDSTFNPASTSFLVPNVTSIAVQTDGKILVGSNPNIVRVALQRLNANGTIDTAFMPNVSSVNVVALQTDGKIIIGGGFGTVNSITRNGIARVNSDGTLDTTFGNGQTGINNAVLAVALQTDGKVIAVGLFQTVNGVARGGVARLNADGTLDTTFGNGLTGTTATVYSVRVQTDGKIVIGGGFGTAPINGILRGNIARLNADGTLDTTFGNGLVGADNNVFAIAIQTDEKVIIGGQFKFVNGVPRVGIARLANFTPTASAVIAGGRITTTGGRGISKGQITMTKTNGETRVILSNPFGYFRFNDVQVGETYIFSVKSKRYTFSQPSQVISINNKIDDINFVANN
jgi:uncharacterized delta-60 repeat protein